MLSRLGPAAAMAAVVIVLLLVVAVVVVVLRARQDPGARALHHAQQLVADDDNFVTATESGVTFTKVSSALEDAADDCHPANTARCANLYASAGYARVSAVGVLRCTRPGVFDARHAMRTLLDRLDADRTGKVAIPAVVSCR